MKLLLDTHAFLWAISSDSRLSSQAVAAFEEGELLLSAASVWEIVTKHQIGKLQLPSPPSEFLPEHFERNAIGLLPILPRQCSGWSACRSSTRIHLIASWSPRRWKRAWRF